MYRSAAGGPPTVPGADRSPVTRSLVTGHAFSASPSFRRRHREMAVCGGIVAPQGRRWRRTVLTPEPAENGYVPSVADSVGGLSRFGQRCDRIPAVVLHRVTIRARRRQVSIHASTEDVQVGADTGDGAAHQHAVVRADDAVYPGRRTRQASASSRAPRRARSSSVRARRRRDSARVSGHWLAA